MSPGSSSQHSTCWLRHMPVHWTRPIHLWSRRSRDPWPPPAGKGALLEVLSRRPVFTRFGFTRAKQYVGFGFWTFSNAKASEAHDGQKCVEIRHTATRSLDTETVGHGFKNMFEVCYTESLLFTKWPQRRKYQGSLRCGFSYRFVVVRCG